MVGYIFFDGQPGSVLVFYFLAMGANGEKCPNGIFKVLFKRLQTPVQHLEQFNGQSRIFFDCLAQVPLVDAKGPGIFARDDTGGPYQVIDEAISPK